MFRSSDVRRLQAACDAVLPAPYDAEVALNAERTTMGAAIMDPDDATLPVAQAMWIFDSSLKSGVKQPSDADIAAVCQQLAADCTAYPARKAAEAIEHAQRVAIQEAIAAAKAAEAAAIAAEEAAAAAAAAAEQGEDPGP